MDCSKAFDTTCGEVEDHPPQSEVGELVFLSFLVDHKQRVLCNGVTCEWKEVNKGTTQGSERGPYLLNIFLNDLEIEGLNDESLLKSADDSTLIITVGRSISQSVSQSVSRSVSQSVSQLIYN